MSKARDLADFISTGSIFTDGAIASTEITGVTADASEINKLDGVTASTAEINKLTGVTASTAEINKLDGLNASTAELNQVVGATSALQTQLDNISVTSGSLTKTFTQNETADITLSQSITSAPVVSATKEVPQTGVSTKGNWDVNSTASNYDFHDTATNVTLTPTTTNSFSYPDTGSLVDTYTVSGYTMKISSDGTKMYLLSASNNSVQVYNFQSGYEYDLDYVSIDTGNTLSGLSGIFSVEVNSDGTKVFVNSSTIGYMYTLSTAHDLTTATLASQVTFNNIPSLGNMGTVPVARFNSDGTKMFLASSTYSSIVQIDLSTAFDVTTGSYNSVNLVVSNQDSTPFGMDFNTEGSRLVMGGASNNQYYEYTLTTNFDLSTASYSSNGRAVGNNYYRVALADNFLYAYDGSQIIRWQGTAITSNAIALGSGSFASTDVGKRIVGNGGDVILTSTGGAFDATGGSAFTDNSTIAAGSWSMFGLKSAGDADGITMSSGGGSGAVDIDQAIEGSNTYDFSSTFTQGIDVSFKPDGTKMFLANYGGNKIHEFSLSTAWDLTTASFVREYGWSSASYGGQTSSVAFKSDGTKMFVLNWGFDYLIQISLPTAWSLYNASVDAVQDVTHSSWGSVNNPVGLVFNPDGTKLYMNANSGHKTVQINLNAAWNISGGKTLAHTFSTTNQFQGPTGLAFNTDGTKIFIARESSSIVYQYSLSTAYDLSTISYDNKSLNLQTSSTYSGVLYGMYYRSDADIFYAQAYNNSKVHEWNLQSFVQPTGQYHVGVTNSGGQIDSQYFTDINSMTAAESAGSGTAHYAVSTDGRTTWSVAKGTDGVRPIVRNNSGTWQYNNASTYTGTTWVNGSTNDEFYTLQQSLGSGIAEAQTSFGGLGSVTYDTKTFSVASQDTDPRGVSFNNDGTKMFVAGNSGDDIYQYTLSTANDISTATYNSNFAAQGTNVLDVIFNNDGTKMYVPSSQPTPSRVYEYNLSTAFDLSTASYNSVSLSLSGQSNSSCHGISFNNNGTKLYAAISSSNLYEYALTTAYDLSTASYNNATFNASGQVSDISGVTFNTDGTKMFISDNGTDKVFQYSLSTAFDLSTASYDSVQLSITVDTDVEGVRFSPDFSKMYIVGAQNNTIYQYSTGVTTTQLNRMDKTQLDAVADANHFSTGNSLDLMIALRMDTAASTLPTSDGVTLNYDAAALNEGAVLGTDYDFFFPANNKVQIKSLAAQNLKVRVV